MAWTLSEANAFLTACETAYLGALGGKAVKYGGKDVTYQDVDWLSAELDKWQDLVNKLEAKAAGATNPRMRIATWS